MITVAHFYNEIVNHYDNSTQEKLGGANYATCHTLWQSHLGRARAPSGKQKWRVEALKSKTSQT